MSSIFTEQKREIPTKFTSYIRKDGVLPFKNYRVWIGFSNGNWIFWDSLKHDLINTGLFEGNRSDLVHLFYKPKIFNDEQIVYISVPNLKLYLLNPYKATIDTTWDVDCPTTATLSEADRKNQEKAQDTMDDLDILVLEKTKTVILMERRDQANNNSEYALTAFVHPKKSGYATVSASSQMKKMYMTKLNEEDQVLLYSDYQQPKMKFQIWNLSKTEDGLKTHEFEEQISATITWAGAWEKGQVMMFGNPDQGNPQSFFCDYEKRSMPKPDELTNLQNSEVIVEDCIWIDPKQQRCLFEESGYQKWKCLTLYNLKTRKTEFGKQLPYGDHLYVLSPDSKYFVSYKCQMVGDEDPAKPGKTDIHVYTFTKKKAWVVFLMKRAKLPGKNESLLNYFGSPYIAQHVAEIIGK